MRLTAQNLVSAIQGLPHDIAFQYVHKSNHGRIVVHQIHLPEGPIEFKRYDPSKGERLDDAKLETISTQMLWRMANAVLPDRPVNVDRIFGGSYNTRSVLEALIAHTPQFHWCRPGRIEQINTRKSVKPGHKHLIYLPNEPHENGVVTYKDVTINISEVTVDAVYQGITLDPVAPDTSMTVDQKREHSRMQIALVVIGSHLGFRTWVAANDRSIHYAGKRIAEFSGVVDSLNNEQVLSAYPKAASAGRLIDCIWFRNGRLMPAVMEVEHSTGVTSGLARMKGLFDSGPALRDIRWTIVAPDEDRSKVIEQANREQFKPMKVKFFPYSAVNELFSLCERRKPKGVTDEFLDAFMEECVT
jgi:hypothetical protein